MRTLPLPLVMLATLMTPAATVAMPEPALPPAAVLGEAELDRVTAGVALLLPAVQVAEVLPAMVEYGVLLLSTDGRIPLPAGLLPGRPREPAAWVAQVLPYLEQQSISIGR
jgi:hypothetical protein